MHANLIYVKHIPFLRAGERDKINQNYQSNLSVVFYNRSPSSVFGTKLLTYY